MLCCVNLPDWILATKNPDRYNGLNQFQRMAPPWWGTESAVICDWHGHSRPPPWATKCQISLMVSKGDRARSLVYQLSLDHWMLFLQYMAYVRGLLVVNCFILSRKLRNQSWPAVCWVREPGMEKKRRSWENEAKYNCLHFTFRATSISPYLNPVLTCWELSLQPVFPRKTDNTKKKGKGKQNFSHLLSENRPYGF